MVKMNNRLNAIAASTIEQGKASEEEVVGLLRQWAWMDIVRGVLAMVGRLAGVWSVMEQRV